MLLWEILNRAERSVDDHPLEAENGIRPLAGLLRTHRLPYEKRCAALTKSGRRCRGRIREGSDWCLFHDPAIAAKRRLQSPSSAKRRLRRLSHLPDGYLRKLSNRRAVGEAMDRLYREVRLGVVSAEMGNVLFAILTRILDSGLVTDARTGAADRSKAGRIRPKLNELLTRAERSAWRRAVAQAPEQVLLSVADKPSSNAADAVRSARPRPPATGNSAPPTAFQAAS